jgi:hypothetical protein
VATLIVQEQLAQRSGCDLSHLMGNSGEIELAQFLIPKSVEPQCSFVRGASGWVVTASGGVDVNAFEVVQSQQVDPTVAGVRARAVQSDENQSWWWNG